MVTYQRRSTRLFGFCATCFLASNSWADSSVPSAAPALPNASAPVTPGEAPSAASAPATAKPSQAPAPNPVPPLAPPLQSQRPAPLAPAPLAPPQLAPSGAVGSPLHPTPPYPVPQNPALYPPAPSAGAVYPPQQYSTPAYPADAVYPPQPYPTPPYLQYPAPAAPGYPYAPPGYGYAQPPYPTPPPPNQLYPYPQDPATFYPAAPTSLPSTASGAANLGTLPRSATERPTAFSGSYFEWGHRATTSLLGIGADYQSRAYQVYFQSYTLRARYLLSAGPSHRLFALIVPGLDVELTNSNETTRLREPVLRDLPVGLNLDLPLNDAASRWASELRGTLAAILPASLASRASGYYFSLSPRLAWLQNLPLRRAGGFLDDVQLRAVVRYDHLFSRATTAEDSNLNYVRQSSSGISTSSDLLDGSRLSPSSIRTEATLRLTEELFANPFECSASLVAEWDNLYRVGRGEIQIQSGPVTADALPEAPSLRKRLGVRAELRYSPSSWLDVAVGYENVADQNSKQRSLLYTARAAFVGSVLIRLDDVIERARSDSNTTQTAAYTLGQR